MRKGFRKIIACVLSLYVVLGMMPGLVPQASAAADTDTWDGTVAAAFAGGNGASGTPFRIATGAQLAYLASRVNAGDRYDNTFFEMTADIDLDRREWTPIGGESKYFRGTFNGNGHIIFGLSIKTNVTEAGLFGKVQDAVIRNVGLESVDIDLEETTLAGGLVGNMFNKSSGTFIENVYVTGEIATGINVHVGGLAGRSSGPSHGYIKRSYSTANITAGLQGAKVGGLVGTVTSNASAVGIVLSSFDWTSSPLNLSVVEPAVVEFSVVELPVIESFCG